MPWIVEKGHGCPAGKPWAVVNQQTKKVEGCHPSKDAATQQQKALYANEPQTKEASPVGDCGCNEQHTWDVEASAEARWDGPAAMAKCSASKTPASCFGSICAARVSANDADTQAGWALPHHASAGGPADPQGVAAALGRLNQTQGIDKAAARRHLERHQGASKNTKAAPTEGLYRMVCMAPELRERQGSDDNLGVLRGHFVVFNEWTEINSLWEGRFMERFDPHSMDATFSEDRDSMRVLFQHGRDPQIGDKPLGPIDVLEAQRKGGYYEVPLLDTQYNRELLPGLKAGLYGASFRFGVEAENWDKKPGKSRHNPQGIPERTVMVARTAEFGPVTFPAYKKATAGVRSITDRFMNFPVRDVGSEVAETSADENHGAPDAEPGNGEASRITSPTYDELVALSNLRARRGSAVINRILRDHVPPGR